MAEMMADRQFSSEHKAQFERLLGLGDLDAVNLNDDKLAFGPWLICPRRDSRVEGRPEDRFRAAARKAALAAGAPTRIGLVDWWIGGLVEKEKTSWLKGVIQRSIERCETLENEISEMGPPPADVHALFFCGDGDAVWPLASTGAIICRARTVGATRIGNERSDCGRLRQL